MKILSVGKSEFNILSSRVKRNLILKERRRQAFNNTHNYYKIEHSGTALENYVELMVKIDNLFNALRAKRF